MAVLSIGAVAVLALFKGAGLAGSLRGDGRDSVAQMSGMQPGVPAIFGEDNGDNGGDYGDPADYYGESGELRAASAVGRVVLTGDVPEGARLEVDGEAVNEAVGAGAELVLTAGEHKISISAPGFEALEHEVYVDPRTSTELAVNLVRTPVARRSAEPSKPAPLKPAAPQDLIDQLGQLMAQGEELWVMGRYHEAADAFAEVVGRARDAVKTYRDGATLTPLVEKAAGRFEKLKHACHLEGQPSCPK